MKFVIALTLAAVCLWASVSALGLPRTTDSEWEEYKQRYNKVYNSVTENAFRRVLYEKRVMELRQLSAQEDAPSFQRGINQFSDMSHGEYRKLNGLKVSKKPKRGLSEVEDENLAKYMNLNASQVPESVDWREARNRVGPVKYQGHCGSCWAFATVGMLEGQEIRNSTGGVMQLSEQNLLDCDKDNGGCHGGYLELAVDFVAQEGGLETEEDYPYQSIKGQDGFPCRFEKSKSFVTTWSVKGSWMLPEGDENMLKVVVAKYGPVAVGIDASHPSFRDYKSGVYQEKDCTVDEIDHAVLVVGYGTDKVHGDYWLIKNSWSEDWGEKGYFKLARNKNNHCGVASMATITI